MMIFKYILAAIYANLYVTGVLYLVGAFHAATFNIEAWEPESRRALALAWLMSQMIGVLIIIFGVNKEK